MLFIRFPKYVSLSPALLLILAMPLALSGSLQAQFGKKTQYFAQIAIGAGAESVITLHNPNQKKIEVTVEIFDGNGALHDTESIQIQPGETLRQSWGEGVKNLVVGWARLSSTSRFAADLFYSIEGVGNVGVLPSPRSRLSKLLWGEPLP